MAFHHCPVIPSIFRLFRLRSRRHAATWSYARFAFHFAIDYYSFLLLSVLSHSQTGCERRSSLQSFLQ